MLLTLLAGPLSAEGTCILSCAEGPNGLAPACNTFLSIWHDDDDDDEDDGPLGTSND